MVEVTSSEMSQSPSFDPSCLPEMLPVYYKHLFPAKTMFRWLLYGRSKDKSYVRNREWSFTLKDDVYLRYRSYGEAVELEKALAKDAPYKIDIGAVYNNPPKTHRRNPGFEAQERELVFDIDLTDYDDVRRCCSGANMCQKCWRFMVVAVQILDGALRDDFGFEHILYVYSGRRGVHCWVADQSARQLDSTARAAVASYLSVVTGGGETSKKKVKLVAATSKDDGSGPIRRLHPSLSRALDIVHEHFPDIAEEQGYLENEESFAEFVSLFNLNEQSVTHLEKEYRKKLSAQSAREQWGELERVIRKAFPSDAELRIAEVLFQYCYPRLDVNVTTGLNHLLKSPFSVHPKTGKISVPFSIDEAPTFDYESVPRLDQLYLEVSALKAESRDMNAESRDSQQQPMDTGDGQQKPASVAAKPGVDYRRRTLLKHSLEVFEAFVNELPVDNYAVIEDGMIEF